MGQQTFEKLPEIGNGYQYLQERRDAPVSRPPMTSRRAKQEHNKKTAAKKISVAQERMELLRIKAEQIAQDEKNKRERKAEAVREKKRQKELRMKEERKQKGLPLVDVRPSQETLTRFFRGNGSTKKRDSTGAAVQLEAVQEEMSGADSETSSTEKLAGQEEAPLAQQEDIQEMNKNVTGASEPAPAKRCRRFRTGCTPRKEEKQTIGPVRAVSISSRTESSDERDIKSAIQPRQSEQSIPEGRSRESSMCLEDVQEEEDPEYAEWERNYVPTSSDISVQNDILRGLADDMMNEAAARLEKRQRAALVRGNRSSSTRDLYRLQEEYDPYLESCLEDMSEPHDDWTVGFMELQDAQLAAKPPPPQHLARAKPLGETSGNRTSSKQLMPPPPPPLPVTSKALSSVPASGLDRPRPLAQDVNTPSSRSLLGQATHGSTKQSIDSADSDMPSCTQLLNISMADLVDILPSPSQEVLELGGPAMASKLYPALKPAVVKPQLPVVEPKPTVWKPSPPFWKPTRPTAPSQVHKTAQPMSQVAALAPLTEEMGFFMSTQDLVFSSQDMREVETPSRPQARPEVAAAVKPLGTTPVIKPALLGPRPDPALPVVADSRVMTDLLDDMQDSRVNKPMPRGMFANAVAKDAAMIATQRPPAFILGTRFGRQSCQAGTPQAPSSAQTSAGLAHETPCRVGVASAPRTLSTAAMPGGGSIPAPSVAMIEPQPEPPKLSASPPRKRMLTSSNIPLLVAEERSRKSFREDIRKRELKEQEEQMLRRKEEEDRQKREAEDLRLLQEDADKAMMENSSIDDLMNDDFFLQQMFSQRMYTAISQAKASDMLNGSVASQETDYGDLDFPSMTQLYVAPIQRKKGGSTVVRQIEASQETDYGDIDMDIAGTDIEVILEEVDFTDDDYP